jgi:hypothetical protein
VRSRVGQGSCFTVLLPVAEGVVSAPEKPKEVSLPPGEGSQVLVVDDEAMIRKVARQALEAHGYRVLEAENGAEAVDAYRRWGKTIDTVLLDLMMPVMDGAEAIVELRKLDPDVRIVATTGYATAGRMDRVLEAGIPYLPKPYSREALLRAVASRRGAKGSAGTP